MATRVDKDVFTQGAEFAGPVVLSDGTRLVGNDGKGGIDMSAGPVGGATGRLKIFIDGVEYHIPINATS